MKLKVFVAALGLMLGQMAFATPELQITSGASDTGVIVGVGSTVSFSSADFNGWEIDIVFGRSHSPSLSPFGIDITSLTATCTGGTCSSDPLVVNLTDTGFTQVVGAGGFTTTYSSTQVGGSTTQTAWDDTSNTAFGHGTLIGSVGPFTSSSAASASGGGPAGPGAYSLTIQDVFDAKGGAAAFSTDGNITAVPEPGAVVLLGSALVLCAAGLRRRRASKG